MPIVTVLGVPKDKDEFFLSQLLGAIREEISLVKELGLCTDQVSVFFPSDLYQPGLGEEICISVALYEKPERTEEVIHRMAAAIQQKVKKGFFPDSLVEVMPQMLNPKHCSSSED